MKLRASLLACMVLLALPACSPSSPSADGTGWHDDSDTIKPPSESEVRKMLQEYFDNNPVCTPFFDMPHDVNADSPFEQKRMQAFIDAGLLRSEGPKRVSDPGSGEGFRDVIRYGLTSEGQKYIRPGAGAMATYKWVICLGRRNVREVSVGEVDQTMQTLDVRYKYDLADQPAWLSASSIEAFYPVLKGWLARQGEDREELRFANGTWDFDRRPEPEMFDFRELSH